MAEVAGVEVAAVEVAVVEAAVVEVAGLEVAGVLRASRTNPPALEQLHKCTLAISKEGPACSVCSPRSAHGMCPMQLANP